MKNSPNKHLLVIRLSAMGDVAISIPVLTALSEQYPELKLTIVTRPLFAPMFTHLPNCQVFPLDLKNKHKGIIGLYRLFKELKKNSPTGIADLHNVLRTNILKLFFSFSSVPFKQINKGRSEKKALTRAKNKIFVPLLPSYIRYAKVFESLGFPITLEKNYFAPSPPLSQKIQDMLSKYKNIGIAPFASHKGKEYPFEQMKKVILSISEKYPTFNIFIFGGGNREKELVQSLPSLKNVKNIIGILSFAEELSLIAHLQLMVAMDSGNAHLAAMYGVPTITLWGVTHPFAGFYPYGQDSSNALLADRTIFPLIPTSVFGNKYPEGYEKSITTISLQDILNKIDSFLEK